MKLYLTISGGSLAGQSFELETGFLTVGRSEMCSIRFDPLTERIASKQHAFIEAKADGFYVTDNQSTNGTFVNGERVQVAKLSSGDTIQFGRNGVLASVRIEEAPVSAVTVDPTRAEFREAQLEQFNSLAQSQPDSMQNSIANLGLGSIQMQIRGEPEKKQKKNYVGAAIALLAIVFLSLVVIVLITASLSPSSDGSMTINLEGVFFAFIASFVAFIPAIFYILPLMWLDRYDPEPFWLLALAFAWGALVAVIVSFIVNTGLSYLAFKITKDAGAANAIGAVVSAPIFEEGSKGFGLVILLIFFRRYFDDILDGIVFAGVIGLGFATVENVLYYGNAIGNSPTGLVGSSLAFLFVLRGVMSPFAHVTFTSMTGIGCGISRESHNTFVRILMPVLGYIGAVCLHALWNGMAVLGGLGGFILGYLVLEVPFFLIFVGFAFYIMHRQNKILKEMLAIDIARGLIPEEHAQKATSAFRSSGWLMSGLFGGKFRPRSRYLRAIGKLGLSYWHIQRATAAQGHTASFQQNPILREEVLKWRDQV